MISVIIPVYNVEAYLKRCIDSVLNQTYKDIELILVDDGSTDTSFQICKWYQDKDERVRVVQQDHLGAANARKTGVEIARGDYIGFVDSDDWIALNIYEDMIRTADKYEADIVQCEYSDVFGDSYENAVAEQPLSIRILSSDDVLDDLFRIKEENNINYLLWNKIYRKCLFGKFDFPIDSKIINDVPVIPRACFFAQKIICINRPYYFYFHRTTNDNIMSMASKSKKTMVLSHVEAFNSVSLFFKYVDSTAYEKSLKLTLSWVASSINLNGLTKEEKKWLKSIVKGHCLLGNKYLSFKQKMACTFISLLY